jgi:hypothetical protein
MQQALTRIIHERFCCKRGYTAATGSLAVQPFDILHEYASGLHDSECPFSLRVCTLSRRTVMNNAG